MRGHIIVHTDLVACGEGECGSRTGAYAAALGHELVAAALPPLLRMVGTLTNAVCTTQSAA